MGVATLCMEQSNDNNNNNNDDEKKSVVASSPSKPIKGILKNPNSDSKHKDKALVWDEEKLAETEAEKGGRMKIDEPKTPYRAVGSLDDEEYEQEIQAMIESAKKTLEENEKKPKDFEAKRKMHYQKEEGEVLRKLKAKKMVQKKGDDEEEEDKEDDE